MVVAHTEIYGFFRNVGIPDEHELIEGNIGPENTEGKHEQSHIMQMTGVDHLQIVFFLKINNKQRAHGNPIYPIAGEGVPPVHGAVPMRVDAHEPVPCHHQDVNSEKDKKQ